MNLSYKEWIDHLPDNVTSQCAERTLEMQKQFPKLIRVRGFYHCPRWGKSSHWWLKTKDNQIIDPTAKQFCAGGIYEEHDESQPEPTGKCPNCGEYCYDNKSLCSKVCEKQYITYLNRV